MGIVIDFETRSPVDIKVNGSTRYCSSDETEVLLMGYKVDDGPTRMWYPGDPVLEGISSSVIYAFNAAFDLRIWNNIMVPKFGFPKLKLEQVHDVQALCARYGLPQNLSEAAKVLKVQTQKNEAGKKLIQMFCVPPYADNTGSMWDMFVQYCLDDVEATYQVLKALPSDYLSDEEHKIWRLNYEINERGIPVDVPMAEQVAKVTTAYLAEHNNRLPELTGGKVTKVTQVKRIKTWMEERGYPVPTLQAAELQKLLLRDDLPEDVVEVLELRAGMGLSSLGKYQRIINENHSGRMHFGSRYYGAHTGRVTGMGFQPLNLPRASVKDVEGEIERFFDLSICYDNPVLSARALVRPLICATPGNILVTADYASIEYILLMWLCEEHKAVERFAAGFDQYKDLATTMYNVPYEQVEKPQRQMGKYGILGCGYGLGWQGFVGYADRFGKKVSVQVAKDVVGSFRRAYPNVPKFWYALNDCAKAAIEMPGRTFETNRTKFRLVADRNKKRWLQMTLPSGRALYYFNPAIEPGLYGPEVISWSMHQTSKTWMKKSMTPGKWAENVIQAIGRDLLYYGKFKLKEAGYPIVFSIYDEVVAECPEERANLEEFCSLMSSVPPWAEGLPVRAEGYVAKRYRKD